MRWAKDRWASKQGLFLPRYLFLPSLSLPLDSLSSLSTSPKTYRRRRAAAGAACGLVEAVMQAGRRGHGKPERKRRGHFPPVFSFLFVCFESDRNRNVKNDERRKKKNLAFERSTFPILRPKSTNPGRLGVSNHRQRSKKQGNCTGNGGGACENARGLFDGSFLFSFAFFRFAKPWHLLRSGFSQPSRSLALPPFLSLSLSPPGRAGHLSNPK